ncbi:MAG TPA: hypothetical protein VGO09_08320 [Flavisolibacter sp.]|jgi:hypothetical protein|nr:hypothetical protein [Flavisolibacter sp.]
MKKGILFLLLLVSFYGQAQSLRDALYGGKLKNEPGTVIHKGDDLASKMDTARKANDSVLKVKLVKSEADSLAKNTTHQPDPVLNSNLEKANPNPNSNIISTDTSLAITDKAVKETAPVSKNNNVLWKEHIDSLKSTWKTDFLNSKKVKPGTYYVTLSYTIGTDGLVDVTDIFLSPENSFLQQQLKDRLNVDAPRMSPSLSSNGTPRKVSKKYNFTLTK